MSSIINEVGNADIRGALISSRVVQLYGDVEESGYEVGKYFIGGQEVNELLQEAERELFVFVQDYGKVVTVACSIEAGPEDAMEPGDDPSGIAKFVAIPHASKQKAGVKKEVVALTGTVDEVGMGAFYITNAEGKPENLHGNIILCLQRASDGLPDVLSRTCSPATMRNPYCNREGRSAQMKTTAKFRTGDLR